MNSILDKIQSQLQSKKYTNISSSNLAFLLKEFQLVQEENTVISGKIRILAGAQSYWIQEEDPKGKIFIRKFSMLDDAQKFIYDRLATYDKMWDGCGCKVDYYA